MPGRLLPSPSITYRCPTDWAGLVLAVKAASDWCRSQPDYGLIPRGQRGIVVYVLGQICSCQQKWCLCFHGYSWGERMIKRMYRNTVCFLTQQLWLDWKWTVSCYDSNLSVPKYKQGCRAGVREMGLMCQDAEKMGLDWFQSALKSVPSLLVLPPELLVVNKGWDVKRTSGSHPNPNPISQPP